MNHEDIHEYYDQKEKENLELVEVWCWALVISFALGTLILAVIGAKELFINHG
jgi:hypothetical protein